jgi:hypothetical protein
MNKDLNTLAWDQENVCQSYFSRQGYNVMIYGGDQGKVWWWSKTWKIKAPKKMRIFLWLSLWNRVLTWDMLQKMGRHGPSTCYMCRGVEKNIGHLIIHCLYAQKN